MGSTEMKYVISLSARSRILLINVYEKIMNDKCKLYKLVGIDDPLLKLS